MNKQLQKELETLLAVASPTSLRYSITRVYHSWLTGLEEFPGDFKQVTEDFYVLYRFLEKAERVVQGREPRAKNQESSTKQTIVGKTVKEADEGKLTSHKSVMKKLRNKPKTFKNDLSKKYNH